MTNQEWQECSDPQPMIAALEGRVAELTLRQFAAQCCRRIWPLIVEANAGGEAAAAANERAISQPVSNTDVERVEPYTVAAAACAAFAAAAVGANLEGETDEAKRLASHAAFASSALTGTGYADDGAMIWSVAADAGFADDANHDTTERKAQADLLRTLVGNPISNSR